MRTAASRFKMSFVVALMTFPGPAGAQSNVTSDADAARMVAVQLREQGYACTEPTSAKRDPEADDDAVWILTCNNASYRVRLVPDQAAKVEQIN